MRQPCQHTIDVEGGDFQALSGGHGAWLAVAVSAIEDCPVSINLPRMRGERGVTMAAR
jgi:hypothetical protein